MKSSESERKIEQKGVKSGILESNILKIKRNGNEENTWVDPLGFFQGVVFHFYFQTTYSGSG